MKWRPTAFWLVLALAVVSLACDREELTQIVVVVETDYQVPAELSRVEFSASSGTDTQVTSVLLVGDSAPAFPLSLTYVPDGASDAALAVTVTGFNIADESLVSQTRTTAFAPAASLTLRMDLSRTCAGVSCLDPNTCAPAPRGGSCEPAMKSPGALPPFVPGQATGGAELCNGRDDDGDGQVDNGFEFEDDIAHCGGCFSSCPVPREFGEATCSGSVCGVSCQEQRADCDGDIDNGCETSFLDGDNCGGCGIECAASEPICDEITPGDFRCVTGCTGDETLCEDRCTDLMTSTFDCGMCDYACPDNDQGTAVCVAGACSPECAESAHACGELCQSNSAIDSCGARCNDPCPRGSGTEAVCERDECFLACADNQFDCDHDSANGCEVFRTQQGRRLSLQAEPNCGGCGVRCGAGSCDAGECSILVTDFELGPRHGCALMVGGAIWCWGANEAGQLGIPVSMTPEAAPIRVPFNPPGPNVMRTLAAMDDETSYFLLTQNAGHLGVFITTNAIGRSPVDGMLFVPAAPLNLASGAIVVVDRGVALSHSFFATNLYGWGVDSFDTFTALCGAGGCSGLPGSTIVTSGLVTPGFETRRLARGGSATCTNLLGDIAARTQLQCWGTAPAAERAYIGDGTDSGSVDPVVVNPTGADFVFGTGFGVDLAAQVGCATFREGGSSRPYCWGDWGGCGGFGLAPTRVPGTLVDGAGELTVGDTTGCVVRRSDGSLICWGRDLVDGSCNATPVYARPEFAGIRKAQVSTDFGCVLLGADADTGRLGAPGSLWCWGNNGHGQLGVGPASDESFGPRQVVFE